MSTTLFERAPSPLAETLKAFFTVKTSCDVAGTMAHFSPDLVTYTDATLGWALDGYDAVQSIFEQYMPNWQPPARSYATGVQSNARSAIIHMVDTPELFGGELRILAAVDFTDGKIVRWIDYWDGSAFNAELYAQMRTSADAFPTDFKDDVVPTQASPELVELATALYESFAKADVAAATDVLHADVVFEDMTLRTRIVGRIETAAYLARTLTDLPYGLGNALRHMVGGAAGGAFEWTASDGLVGITAIELDGEGRITRITSVYDGRQIAIGRKARLLRAAMPTT